MSSFTLPRYLGYKGGVGANEGFVALFDSLSMFSRQGKLLSGFYMVRYTPFLL